LWAFPLPVSISNPGPYFATSFPGWGLVSFQSASSSGESLFFSFDFAIFYCAKLTFVSTDHGIPEGLPTALLAFRIRLPISRRFYTLSVLRQRDFDVLLQFLDFLRYRCGFRDGHPCALIHLSDFFSSVFLTTCVHCRFGSAYSDRSLVLLFGRYVQTISCPHRIAGGLSSQDRL
jgi:hypothetical protein